jgi:hypothetical protein
VGIERMRELRRRRHRRKKLIKLNQKFRKSNAAEHAAIAEKIRRLTPGAEVIIKDWGIRGV